MNCKNILCEKKFWPIFWTQFFGALNDNIFKNGLVILITIKSYALAGLDAKMMVAMCGGIFILPFFLFSAIAGKLADKYSKSTCIRIVKISELLIMLIGSFGFITENLIILLITLFLMGLQSTIFGPIKYSILPELLENSKLVTGNAYVGMGTFVSILIGTIMGGLLISVPQFGGLLTSSAVIIVAIFGIISGFLVNHLDSADPNIKIGLNPLTPTKDILKIIRKTRSVFLAILGISWFWFLGAAFLSLIPPYANTFLHADEHVITLFLALFSIGIGTGSIICEKLSFKQLELGLVPIGSIGMSIFLLDLYLINVPNFIINADGTVAIINFFTNFMGLRIIFDLLLFSIFGGFYIVPLYTMIQMRTPSGIRSQTVAGNNILNALFMVAASVMLIVLFKLHLTIPQIYLVLFFLNIIVAIYIYIVIPEFLLRFLCFILSRIIYRLKITGKENLPNEGPCVLVCNHISFIDWLFIASSSVRPVRFIMDYNYIKTSFMRYLMRQMKVIPIASSAENRKVLLNAFKEINNALTEGEIVCIFPEGAITRTGDINTFKTGIERIARENKVSIIPMTLNGLWGSFFSRKYGPAMSSNPFKKLWCKITLKIGQPVSYENVTAAQLEHITKEMFENN